MIKVPKIQEDWFKENFALNKRDFPIEFMDIPYFIDLCLDKGCFRGLSYNGNSMSFSEEIISSYRLHQSRNKKRFNLLFNQLIFLSKECLKNEYYELLTNLSLILVNCQDAVNTIKEEDADIEVHFLLVEMGLKKDNSTWTY